MYLLAVGTLALCFAVYKLLKLIPRYLKWRSMKAIPGPECSFWLGQLPTIRREPYMEPHKRWLKAVGENAPVIRYSTVLGANALLIFDTDIIKEILTAPATKDDCRFKKPIFFLPDIIGQGLVTLEGEEWAKHRRIIHPAFSASHLRESLRECVPPKVQAFIQYWLTAGEGQEIDAGTHLSALTLDVIGDAGFSYDTNGLKDIEAWSKAAAKASQEGKNGVFQNPELTDPLITSLTALLKPNVVRLILFLSGVGFLDRMFNPTTIKVRAALDSTVEGIITNAKQKNDVNIDSASSKGAKSLIQLLLQANDNDASASSGKNATLSEVELKDEMKTFLLAGHETTSTWCYWAFYAMAKYPDVQEKLFVDVTKGMKGSNGTTFSLEEVEGMGYLSAFLNEVLRMFPPVGMMIRLNCYDEKFAGYDVPKNTNLVVPVHLLHRHQKYWEDPETFKPERWMQGSDGPVGGIDNRGFTFLPFGAGGHNCIGYKFATMEAKMIIAQMVGSLRVEIAPSQRDVEHTFTSIVTMKAKPGLKIVVKSRK